ncbi:hypothetical protein LTS18_006731, partial [Coniosporium uncinatum]
QQLDDALLHNGVQHCELKNVEEPPRLAFSATAPLLYVHGRHRLAAAEEFLEPIDRWWTAELYFRDIPGTAKAYLREQYLNCRNCSDGEIYRYIRLYQKSGDEQGERRWRSRLSPSKTKALKQLQSQCHGSIVGCLDELVQFPGLWNSFQLGSFPTILSLRCPEEVCNYLRTVNEVWHTITIRSASLATSLDYTTVERLQSLCPGLSSQDRDLVENLMEDRVIFPHEERMETRDETTRAILTVPTLIVTLRTFFDDVKYLQPAVLSLKRLFPSANHLSLREAVRKSYVAAHADHGQVYMENAENVGQRLSLPYEKHVDSGYLQLLLYIWRHFPEMTSVDTKKSRASRQTNNAYRAGVRRDGEYHCRWINLAKLAPTLGFDNEEIRRLKARDPDIEVIRRNLLHLRPKHLFEIEPHSFDLEVNRQLEALASFSRRRIYLNYPEINTDHGGPPPSARCGKPDQTSQDLDRCYMFLQNVTRREDHPLRKSITSFAVKRLIIHAFMGELANIPVDDDDPYDSIYSCYRQIEYEPECQDSRTDPTSLTSRKKRKLSPTTDDVECTPTRPGMVFPSLTDDIVEAPQTIHIVTTCVRQMVSKYLAERIVTFAKLDADWTVKERDIYATTSTCTVEDMQAIAATIDERVKSGSYRVMQSFGILVRGRMKAIDFRTITPDALKTSDIPGVVFFVDSDVLGSQFYTLPFEDLCVKMYGTTVSDERLKEVEGLRTVM